MAHVKVVRRSMGQEQWIRLRAGWLGRHIISQSTEITGWQIREARQVGEMQYEYIDEDYKPLTKGDMMFSPDGTAFMKTEFVIPECMDGCKVFMRLKTAAEMMVKVNGKWQDGIDPNRTRMLLVEKAKAGDKYSIFMEGYNRSKPDDERSVETRSLRGCRQEFSGVFLEVLDDEIVQATMDINILLDYIAGEYLSEDIKSFIIDRLNNAMLTLNIVHGSDEPINKIKLAEFRKILDEEIFTSDVYKPTGKVALVAHSHLDLAYFWRRIHTVQKNARTCLIQMALMDRHEDFTYCHTQAFTYELLEKHYPEIFERLKEKVANNQFELVGAMYVEPDCNVPSAESMVRQCMYGQHYYRKTFNRIVENCWLPDVFGNSWILPQILIKSGVKYFVSNKMSTWNDTNRFPHNHFIWRGIDGTDIFACVPPTHFITWNDPSQVLENWEAFIDKNSCEETLNMFGYGDGGSGVTEEMLEYKERLNKLPGLPETRHIRGDQFLEETFENAQNLSTWDGELYLEMHRGTSTTKSALKKKNRTTESLLREGEIVATIAALGGKEFPLKQFENAWKKCLVNQFHDILPGTHVAPVTNDALNDYKEVEQEINSEIDSIYQGMTDNDDKNISIFNSLTWDRTSPVFIADAKIENGQSDVRNGLEGFWINTKLDAMSFTIIDNSSSLESDTQWLDINDKNIETPLYKLSFENDGSITRLYDKTLKREVVLKGGKLNDLKAYHDYPGMYDAWDILQSYKDKEDKFEIVEPIKLESVGEICAIFVVKLALNKSKFTQRIRLFKDDGLIEFEHDVDWYERHRLIKAEFQYDLLARYVKCDTSAGSIMRETHKNTTWQQARFEGVMHKWADISETDFGVSLVNDSKYGLSYTENGYGISLLRGNVRPDSFSDIGQHKFCYGIIPHDGTPEQSGINQKAWTYNTPVKAIQGSVDSSPILKVSSSNLHLQAMKYSENGENAIIIRFIEMEGKRGKASVETAFDFKSAKIVNLLEDNCNLDNNTRFDKKTISFSYKSNEIVTIKVTL